jgi:hypothetical protein
MVCFLHIHDFKTKHCILRTCNYQNCDGKLTKGSREMIRTVLSAKPTARKRDLCSPAGTFASAIHTASDGISFRSVYSLSCPVYKPTFHITEKHSCSWTSHFFMHSYKNFRTKCYKRFFPLEMHCNSCFNNSPEGGSTVMKLSNVLI